MRETPSPLDLLSELLLAPPHNFWLAPRAVLVDEDRRMIEVALDFRKDLGRDPENDMFHGGVIASLVDIVGHASVAVWLGGGVTPTISLQVDYLAPAPGPELRATGLLRKAGRTIGFADIEIRAGGKLVALGRGHFSTAGR